MNQLSGINNQEKHVCLATITTPSHLYHMITDTAVVAMNITTYQAVKNQRNGTVEWNTGMEYQNDLNDMNV